jgi:cell division septal protein FtsQ
MARSPANSKPDRDGAVWRARLITMALRYGLWTLALVAVVLALLGAGHSAHMAFFENNPNFVLRQVQVEVRGGSLRPDDVKQLLANQQVAAGESNIFALDPALLRARLESDPMVQRAELRRRLPETLEVCVFGRTPVVQLYAPGGQLLDDQGVSLPPSPRGDYQQLPVLTGLRELGQFRPGQVVDHPMVKATLDLLRLLATTPEGKIIQPKVIQVTASSQELTLLLNPSPAAMIRDGCQLVLPARDLQAALARASAVLRDRAAANQPTGRIDATYARVPVEP